MPQCQQFRDGESNAMESKASKRLRVDEYDNEEGQNSDKYLGKVSRYIFIFLCLQKKSNRLTNLGKEIKGLNQLIYIPKLLYQMIANFVLEFSDKKSLKA